MGFLDNSGDIILDAVLTDEGRKRLAKGDGSFNIVKFSLGDDEVDYALYNKNHASGSAYYDLEILQTPVLEAFTDAGSSLKSPLITHMSNDKLFLPVLRLNTKLSSTATAATTGSYHVAVTKVSRDAFSDLDGTLDGFAPKAGESFIRIDQGLDTAFEVPADTPLDAEDRETQYTILVDNRLGELTDLNGRALKKSFVDDDNIATYYVTLRANPKVVLLNTETEQATGSEVIEGPRGTMLQFKIKSTLNLRRSNYLFDNIGSTGALVSGPSDGSTSTAIRFIDSTIQVMGTTTGYRIDVPVRYVKTSAE